MNTDSLTPIPTAIRKATAEERADVRTYTFSTPSGKEGVVTGIPASTEGLDAPIPTGALGWKFRYGAQVVLYSAGCLHPRPYVIPAGSALVAVSS